MQSVGACRCLTPGPSSLVCQQSRPNQFSLGDTVDSELNAFHGQGLESRWKVPELLERLSTNQQNALFPSLPTFRTLSKNASREGIKDGRFSMTGKNLACFWPCSHRITILQKTRHHARQTGQTNLVLGVENGETSPTGNRAGSAGEA